MESTCRGEVISDYVFKTLATVVHYRSYNSEGISFSPTPRNSPAKNVGGGDEGGRGGEEGACPKATTVTWAYLRTYLRIGLRGEEGVLWCIDL